MIQIADYDYFIFDIFSTMVKTICINLSILAFEIMTVITFNKSLKIYIGFSGKIFAESNSFDKFNCD